MATPLQAGPAPSQALPGQRPFLPEPQQQPSCPPSAPPQLSTPLSWGLQQTGRGL